MQGIKSLLIAKGADLGRGSYGIEEPECGRYSK